MSKDREPTPRSHPLWRAVKLGSGFALILLGLVGLVLPILQGFLFLAAGFGILSTEIPALRRWRRALMSRYRAWRSLRLERRSRGAIEEDRTTRDSSTSPSIALVLMLGWIVAGGNGCLSSKASIEGIVDRDSVSVMLRVDSHPQGARVTDLSTGQHLGVTPLEVELFQLRYEAWHLLNEPEREEELLAEAESEELGFAVRGRPGEKELSETGSESLELRYRLELEGHDPLILSHQIQSAQLPLLQESPRIHLRGRLEPQH